MEFSQPIPLIDRPEFLPKDTSRISPRSLKILGYFIIFSTWLIFVVSVNSFFEVWKFVIAPLATVSNEKYANYKKLFETIDKYVLRLWCIYVVVWCWSVFSWYGLKLFRQAKGVQIRQAD